MIALRSFPTVLRGIESVKISQKPSSVVVCGAKGPRPRFPRVWKTNKRIGTISKSQKLLHCIKGLSNVKEEVYGALDSFIAWELEFPLITVKKAIRSLEELSEWKRIIQVSKWMLSKGQGRTMGTYTILLSALAEDGRLEEAEELWTKLFTQYLESTPRNLFNKMMSVYYHREMHDKMFELFADMEELGVQPNIAIVSMMGIVFKKLGMLDKYEKLNRKYPPTKWVFKYIRGKRVRIRAKGVNEIEFKNNEPNSDQIEKLHNDVEIEESKNKEPNSDQIEKLENESNELEEEEISGYNETHI